MAALTVDLSDLEDLLAATDDPVLAAALAQLGIDDDEA